KDSVASVLYADYAPGLTNSAYTNVTVTGFNYVSFTTTPTSVATVSSAGVVTAVGAGAFTLTGTDAGMTSSAVTGMVTVVTAPPTISGFSVHITDNTNPPPAGSLDAMNYRYLAGAPGVRLPYWNNFLYTSTGGSTNSYNGFYDSKGNTIANMSVSIAAYSQGANNGGIGIVNTATPYSGSSGRTTNESVMFCTYYDQGKNNPSSTAVTDSSIVVSNVPYASYDAYFYFFNDSSTTNRPGRVIIDGNTYWRKNFKGGSSGGGDYQVPDNDGNGYLQAVTPAGFPTYPTLAQIPNGNYIRVSGLTDTNLFVTWGAASVDIVGDAQSVTRMRLAGFQIVQSLAGLTATNVYLGAAPPALFAGNPAAKPIAVLADFVGGIKAGDITTLVTSIVSSDPNVFSVITNGVDIELLAGLTPGIATLTINYQTNVLVTSVTNLAPTSVKITASPATEYYDSSYVSLMNAQATVLATFPGYNNVDISGFTGVSFIDTGSPVCSVDGTGIIYPTGTPGTAAIGFSYLGVNYTNNAFTVRSVNDAPILMHRYSFRDSSSSSTIVDSIGGANGTVYPALSGHLPITLDGDQANFPGDADYTTAPYIALPPNLLTSMGDVTIDCWFTIRTNKDWARIFDFGSSSKGTDPHASGSSSSTFTSIHFAPKKGGNNSAEFGIYLPSGNTFVDGTNASPLSTGVEHHATLVYAPNQGVAKLYIDGVLQGTASPASGATLNTLVQNNSWLGVSDWNDPTLNGSIDEFRIYEGAFTDAQVVSDDANGPSVGLPPLISTAPTNIVTTVSGGNLNLSWPADHLGWILQVQTNALSAGLGTNWVAVPGSTSVTNVAIPINPANGSVFYRLFYQP
ncbi:MAG TPA: LamG domain-containing protein, partial [Candidatus Binatia bacterium]|nr:LamG domain-containing protein [Candidatus Binatia bacterium]